MNFGSTKCKILLRKIPIQGYLIDSTSCAPHPNSGWHCCHDNLLNKESEVCHLLAWMKAVRQLVEGDSSHLINNFLSQSAEGQSFIVRKNWSFHKWLSWVTDLQCFETVEKLTRSRRDTWAKMWIINSDGMSLNIPVGVPCCGGVREGVVSAWGRFRGGAGRKGWLFRVSSAVIRRYLFINHMFSGRRRSLSRAALGYHRNTKGWFDINWITLRWGRLKRLNDSRMEFGYSGEIPYLATRFEYNWCSLELVHRDLN